MKKLTTVLLILLFAIFYGCRDAEVQPKEYPYLVTNEVTDINASGATFSAKIIRGTDNDVIVDYGFIWGSEGKDDFKYSFAESANAPDHFNIRIFTDLIEGKSYFCRAYVITKRYTVYGNSVSFISQGCLPPKITSFTPTSGPIGTQVIVYGENFSISKTGIIVKFGSWTGDVEYSTENEIHVRITEIDKPEKVLITVETAGGKTSTNELFNLWFPWRYVSYHNLQTSYVTSFSIKEKGYIICPNSTAMYVYMPKTNEWNTIYLPETSGNTPFAVASAEKGYVLLNNDLWEFDPLSGLWIKKSKYPGTRPSDIRYFFGFCVNNKIYLGNCYRQYDFWEYDPNLDIWQRKADFIGGFTEPVWGNYTFSTKDKGFLGVSQTAFAINTLWAYDPISNLWFKKSSLPMYAYSNHCCFVINEDAYIGVGCNFEWGDGYVSDQMWKYIISEDRWIRYRNCPVHMAVIASFTFNNKGFLLSYETEFHRELYNIWEFDPAKN